MVKNVPAMHKIVLDPWVGNIPWRRDLWLLTPVFLPGEFHGQRSLVGYSPWSHKESAMAEQLTLSLFTDPLTYNRKIFLNFVVVVIVVVKK